MQQALSFFVNVYRTMAEWRAVVARLDGFEKAIASATTLAADPGSIGITQATTGEIGLQQLLVRLPNGAPLVSAGGISLRAGERTLLMGPSGSGKSTLFRAIAGIWPFGTGSISIPANASLMMLPQRPYFPVGSLQAAIVFPGEAGSFGADRVAEVLTQVGLPQLASRLEEEAHWNRMLSLGEQQRLGLARALLHAPNYLFLDEATASLDEPSEAALYKLLVDKLPATTIVSIGHRSTLDAFHQRNIALVRDGENFVLRDAAKSRPRTRLESNGVSDPAPRPWLAAHPAMPDIAERGQKHRAGQHRRQQERRWQIARYHQQRVDARRRVEGRGHVHRQNGKADGGGRGPGLRPGQLQHGKADQRRHHMPADQSARLRRLDVRRSDHQHDRGGERNHRERIMRGEREQLHDADGNGAAEARDRARHHVAVIVAGDRIPQAPPPILFHLRHPKEKGRQIALPPPRLRREDLTSGWSTRSGQPRA